MRIRYIVPIVPPLTILSMYGLRGLVQRIRLPETINSPPASLSMACLGILMLGYNVQYLYTQFSTVQPLSYVLGKTNREQYITTFRPEYPAIQFANNTVKMDAKVLCLFLGNRGYYMKFQPVFEQPYTSGSILANFLSGTDSTQTVLDEMRQHNIQYILLRTDLTLRWLHQLNETKRQRVTPLFAQSDQPLWSGNGYLVLSLPKP